MQINLSKYSWMVIFLFITIGVINAQTEYKLEKDIKYYPTNTAPNDNYLNERCKLDFYYPTGISHFPVVVWFHGGGLTGGSKEIPQSLTQKGIGVIGVNYRLSPQVKSPAYIEDAAAAVAWTFKNISKYGGDTSKIFVSGHSAGGYLTAMIGLDKSWLNKHHIDACRIAGLIPMSPQVITHFTIRKERNIPEDQPVVDAFAPIYHVKKDTPPILIITGDRELELLGRYEENAYFVRMLGIKGNKKVQLIELQGYDHNMTYPAFPLLIKEVLRISKTVN